MSAHVVVPLCRRGVLNLRARPSSYCRVRVRVVRRLPSSTSSTCSSSSSSSSHSSSKSRDSSSSCRFGGKILRWRDVARNEKKFNTHAVLWEARKKDDDDAKATLVLLLHGGPQVPHDYLKPIGQALSAQRHVVTYDQLGCGLSDAPDDASLYGVDNAIEELRRAIARARQAAGVPSSEKIHVLGQSWGGILAFEAVRTGELGDEIKSLILSNVPPNVAAVEADANRLLEEAGGDVELFMARHNCRVVPQPKQVADAYAKAGSTWRGSGVLAGYEAAKTTSSSWPAHLRTLVISGEHDFVTPELAKTWLDILPHGSASQVVVDGGSHMPFWDASEQYFGRVCAFLDECDDTK